MKVPKPLKVILLVCAVGILLVVGVIVLWTTNGNTRSLGIKPYSDANLPAAIQIHHWDPALTEIVSSDVDMNAEPGRLLALYLARAPSTGGTFSLTTFVPGVVVRSDLVKVNILESGVVISKRSHTSEGFTQWVRDKNTDDEAIEQLARSLLPKPVNQTESSPN